MGREGEGGGGRGRGREGKGEGGEGGGRGRGREGGRGMLAWLIYKPISSLPTIYKPIYKPIDKLHTKEKRQSVLPLHNKP